MPDNECDEHEWIDNELPKIKLFFNKIAKVLDQFAIGHNLKIEKYYHYIPGWEFLFRHPQGGRCYIEILKFDETHVTLMAAIMIHEYDSDLSYNKHTDRVLCSIDERELINKLNEMMRLVLSWEKEELEVIQSKRTTMTIEEYERDLEQYPMPKL